MKFIKLSKNADTLYINCELIESIKEFNNGQNSTVTMNSGRIISTDHSYNEICKMIANE